MALAVGELERRFSGQDWLDATYGRVIRTRDDLHEYQHDCVQFLYEHPRSALFIDVGLGKSVICLTLLADLLKEGWEGRALVIAPLRVAKATWPEEIAEWKQAAGIEYSLIRAEDDDDEIKAVWDAHYKPEYERQRRVGETPAVAARYASRKAAPHRQAAKEAMRQRQTLEDCPLHIINLERLEWLIEFWERRGRETGETWPYDVIIIDESSKFKDFTTKRYRALKKTLSRVTRIHTLTASPAAEGYRHIFAQIFLLDQGRRFGRSIHGFMLKYFTLIKQARKWVIKKNSEKAISNKIADICKVVKLADVRDVVKVEDWLPVPRKIKLNGELQAKYDAFERDLIVKFDEERIEALNGAVLLNKLLQITSGAVYSEDRRIIPVHDEKIEAIRELIDELQGEPLLIGYWYGSSLSRLRKAFPTARVMTKNNVIKFRDDWNAGKIEIGLVQPGSAGHGLNLQKGPGHDLAIFDPLWSRETYEQFIGRLARQGQKQIVRVHQLICVGTADEIVYDCLEDKGAGQERLFQFIREARARMDRRTEEWRLAA
jgi:SNF2 family DNA or RNA helicase